jgi:hypothetical protein
VANDNGDMLDQSESLDSDEVRNRDGDEVADPPDEWVDTEVSESLDEKLAAETPDDARTGRPSSDDDLDHIDPEEHGRLSGQIDGTPEDGDSFFNIEN